MTNREVQDSRRRTMAFDTTLRWGNNNNDLSNQPIHSPDLDQKAAPMSAPTASAQRLVVAAVRGEQDVAAAIALLERAGLPHSDHIVSGLDQAVAMVPQTAIGGFNELGGWMQQHPEGHLLLLMPDPITEVAEALSEGTRPAEALAAWSSSVQQALAVVRAVGRRRSSVMIINHLHANPQAFLKSLGERLQLTLVYRPDDQLEPQSAPSAMFRMMAENAIWQAREVRDVMSECMALALPIELGEQSVVPAVEEVFDEYLESLAAPKEALSVLTKEKNRLHEKLTAVQAEQAQLEAKHAEAQKRLQASKSYQSDLDQAQQQCKDLQEENDLLLQQLHHVQEELERYYLKHVDSSSHELMEAEAKIEALLNSKSWKITRPLRVILGVLTGNKTDL